MKIRNLKTIVIAPVLLLIPMACMHLGDGHHSGHGHFSTHHTSYPYSTYIPMVGGTIGHVDMTTHLNSENRKMS